MKVDRIKQALIDRSMQFLNERRGWKTDRKIVVIESDDWGCIRMPNREVYNRMLKSGIRVDLSNYNKYDTLASVEDFEALYQILRKHKDKNGKNPVITANTIVGNPDFQKIKESDFKEYYFEPFTETLKRYPNHSFDLWKEGMVEELFFPQFHGREHLNVNRWMTYLQRNAKEVHLAFSYRLFGFGPKISLEGNPSFVQAFDLDVSIVKNDFDTIIKEGLELFEQIFEYKSKTFIAPNYIWNEEVEEILSKNHVKFLQGSYIQKIPLVGNKYNFTGKVNKNEQIYLTRNVIFEPSMLIKKDWVSASLVEIERAFKLQKPAIISSHRVNFIGGIFEENRTKNLNLFDDLLSRLTNKWPDIEFMTSVELGNLINTKVI